MGKVLIVDDDIGIVHLLARLVQKKGHTAYIASDGCMALSLAREQQPDLIFTDLKMPDMAGDELISLLRAEPLLASVPLIVLSGNAVTLDLDVIQADAILAKPFQLQTVYNVLDHYLSLSQNLPA
jgi:CheY-like chemotaxis protein